ncbi:hypothetical protein NMY22_g14043 [Coprinellus aureogranulatus]|nr:hypothetical protein NMY22_g14043 [Coprinellus aureogranulatus]
MPPAIVIRAPRPAAGTIFRNEEDETTVSRSFKLQCLQAARHKLREQSSCSVPEPVTTDRPIQEGTESIVPSTRQPPTTDRPKQRAIPSFRETVADSEHTASIQTGRAAASGRRNRANQTDNVKAQSSQEILTTDGGSATVGNFEEVEERQYSDEEVAEGRNAMVCQCNASFSRLDVSHASLLLMPHALAASFMERVEEPAYVESWEADATHTFVIYSKDSKEWNAVGQFVEVHKLAAKRRFRLVVDGNPARKSNPKSITRVPIRSVLFLFRVLVTSALGAGLLWITIRETPAISGVFGALHKRCHCFLSVPHRPDHTYGTEAINSASPHCYRAAQRQGEGFPCELETSYSTRFSSDA